MSQFAAKGTYMVAASVLSFKWNGTFQRLYDRIVIREEFTMKIELHEITIREVAKNYVDNNEEGVVASTAG